VTLPLPDPAFRWTRESWGDALRCRALDDDAQHLFTSVQLELRNLRVGNRTAPEPVDRTTPGGRADSGALDTDAERSAWAKAVGSIGGRLEDLLRVRQVHGRSVRVVRAEDPATDRWRARPDADAIVSNAPGAVLAVVVADCVPVLLVDPVSRAAGAVHAGWRGTSAGVARAAVEAMARAFGTRPANLSAAIGPSIGPEDYEVGESVRDAFLAAHDMASVNRWFTIGLDGRLRLDLWAANRDQLAGAGVPPDRIAICGLSTLGHPDLFASYRRDGPSAGRMAALILVPTAGEAPPLTGKHVGVAPPR
jgi:YfiH family protein